MTDTIETRVARGAALLDDKLPGWVEQIDLDKLDVRSTCNCVLGQALADHPDVNEPVWTGFDVGMAEVIETEMAGACGFDSDDWRPDVTDAEYDALTAEWRRVIEARRSGS